MGSYPNLGSGADTASAPKLLNLGGCDNCGKVYSEAEKVDKSVVTECSEKDCETRWVS
jgi:hypothetical protein